MQPKENQAGITVGEKQFGYNVDYNTHRAEIVYGDKVHVFYLPETIEGYRAEAMKELKRIGWVDENAF